MKHSTRILALLFCLLLFSFTQKKMQTNSIHVTIKDQEQNFSSLAKAEIKKFDGRETLTMEAYQSNDKDSPHIKIIITSEAGKDLEPGDYNFGDKDDFYGSYPLGIYYFKATDDVYSTDVLKCECSIESIDKGKVKGRFEGKLKPEFGNSVEIEDGSFEFDLK